MIFQWIGVYFVFCVVIAYLFPKNVRLNLFFSCLFVFSSFGFLYVSDVYSIDHLKHEAAELGRGMLDEMPLVESVLFPSLYEKKMIKFEEEMMKKLLKPNLKYLEMIGKTKEECAALREKADQQIIETRRQIENIRQKGYRISVETAIDELKADFPQMSEERIERIAERMIQKEFDSN